jgi:hypothetical protein
MWASAPGCAGGIRSAGTADDALRADLETAARFADECAAILAELAAMTMRPDAAVEVKSI